MKPGARRHGDLPTPPPSPFFDAAVEWARERYGITKAPITDWDRWRGWPLEAVMRIVWHGARRSGEMQPTKTSLANRIGMSPSSTAVANASCGPFQDEEEAIEQIMADFSAVKNWIGVRCPDCGEPVPILDAGRELEEFAEVTMPERHECRRIAEEGVRCPSCKRDLRDGVLMATTAPRKEAEA